MTKSAQNNPTVLAFQPSHFIFERMMASRLCFFLLSFCLCTASISGAEESTVPVEISKSVYIIPIHGPIDKPNLFILRRGLKEAIVNEVDMVLLDMDTPGGRVDYTLEMMEMLHRFDGITATYVNDDAISAGSFITASTQEIYFAPSGKIGASAVIQGGGEDVPETARQKIESYLRANIRVMTDKYPYRSDVIRAMLDSKFELKIGDELIKPEGELLTLTAKEAMQAYGDPAEPLLGAGIYESVGDLLDVRFGANGYEIKDFELTYSEELAKWMHTFAPVLMGLGMLLLFVEFKTPGFGVFGIGGITLIAIFFASQYVAGLAGNEPILFFVLGVVLVILEIFLLPGSVVLGLSGLILMLGSLLWAMADIWPEGSGVPLSLDLFVEPMYHLVIALTITVVGAFIVSRLFPGSWLERRLVLSATVGERAASIREDKSSSSIPSVGSSAVAVTDLYPSGRIEVNGKRYEARAALGTIQRGASVRVVRSSDFGLVVEAVEDAT